jgi:hypothetical protein
MTVKMIAHYILESCHLHIHCCEYLTSHSLIVFRNWQQQQHGEVHQELTTHTRDAVASELEHHVERQQLMKTK